jgi:starvation-inducible DNA-binding protein
MMSSVKTSLQRGSSTAQGIKTILADTYLLYLKTQGAHWNIEGPRFYSLHLLFEDQYKELAEAIDTIAEKLRSMGEQAPASFEEFRLLSEIQDYRPNRSEDAILQELSNDHEQIIQRCNKIVQMCQSHSDETTIDLLIERCRAHEKMAWMLHSHFRQ